MNQNKYLSATRLIFQCNLLGLIILALILTVLLASCTNMSNETLIIELEQNRTPKIVAMNLEYTSHYWNKDWLGRPADLYDEIVLVTAAYVQDHDYISGVNDCNDMAVELWQILRDRGVISLITVGNLEKSNESFLECNHSWLMVYSGEGSAAAMDPVSATVYRWEQVPSNPQIKQFWEGFLYENPADLLTDFKDRW